MSKGKAYRIIGYINFGGWSYKFMASAPPSLRGGLKIFGKISKGGPGKFQKFRGGLNLREGAKFLGGAERFLPKSQLNILKV